MIGQTSIQWERMWAPYDEPTYQAVLAHVRPDDVVLDIGAGDLRLAKRIASRARRVVALEINAGLLPATAVLPANLHVLHADARTAPFPPDTTLGVLLMRHCRHYQLYVQKLAAIGCRRLLTNARWGMGVEQVAIQASRLPFTGVAMGWYACACGAVGFVPGPAERLTPTLETFVHEVQNCPICQKG